MARESGRMLSDKQAVMVAKKAGSHLRSHASASQKGISVRSGAIVVTNGKITISKSSTAAKSK